MTKQLASLNDENRKRGGDRKFQLILVGHDDSREANESYLLDKGVNFPAVKLEGREEIESLLSTGETGFLPGLVLLDSDGALVSNDLEAVKKRLRKMVEG